MDIGGRTNVSNNLSKIINYWFSERFILFYLIRMAVYFLLKHRCYHLLVYIVTFLIIFLLTKDQLEEFNMNRSLYLDLLSLVAAWIAIRLLYKKIIRKFYKGVSYLRFLL